MKKSVYNTPMLLTVPLSTEDIMNTSVEQPYETEPEWDGISSALKMS